MAMNDKELRLDCYRATGNLKAARALYAWVAGVAVPEKTPPKAPKKAAKAKK